MNETRLTTDNSSPRRSFIIGNFNNDDCMDIGVTNWDIHNIGVFFGYGIISFSSQAIYSTLPGSSPYSIATGDVNNDVQLDIVVANWGSNTVDVFLGFGNGSIGNQTIYPTDSSLSWITVADFNSDAILDIIVTMYDTNTIGIFIGHMAGTFARIMRISIEYGSHPFLLLVGDFNDNRKLNFVVANEGTDSLDVFLQIC